MFAAVRARPGVRLGLGLLASALLLGLFARGGWAWPLGFVALVPWLRTLEDRPTYTGALLRGWAMSLAFTAAAFAWFGTAIGQYAQWGPPIGLVALLLAAPLFQPQFLAYVLVRQLARRWHGPAVSAGAAAAAWVATEWCFPKLLGDTLGYGLYPSTTLRQAADVGGTAGLTVLLLLTNEAVSMAVARRAGGLRAIAKPLGLAALIPLALAVYGATALSSLGAAAPGPAAKPLRMGLVQSNIIDYDRQRREKGAEAVVREVLDTHFAMSYDAIERQHADAVMWSETVYPLTFGHPKSEGGVEFDREILDIVNQAGVPFVFGTYDVDDAGEYNSAAFVTPGTGLLGHYRKSRPFPLTEYVPSWLDGPVLRSLLPWAGSWRPGTGARVFPLRLKDGREIPVLPLICLDDVDTSLAIDGARLGGQAILTMSNDSWFTSAPLGAQMHQTAAAFRSIETRLPQFRVTTNGHSAVIDSRGSVIAGTRMGERTLVIGDLPVQDKPARTLMLMWGDWVGRAAACLLPALLLVSILRRRWMNSHEANREAADAAALPARVAVLPAGARLVAGVLRAFARASLLWMAVSFVLGAGPFSSNTLAQIRIFAGLFLVPEVVAWLVLRAFSANASLEQGTLVLMRGRQRLTLALSDVAAVEPWRWPLPGAGASLRLVSGERWPHALMHADPAALARVLAAAGGPAVPAVAASRAEVYARACGSVLRGRLDHGLLKFVVLPLLVTVPAFRLHQNIAYGSSFGEYESFGLRAYLDAFGLWWAAWVMAAVLTGAVLRTLVEAGTWVSVLALPTRAGDARRWLHHLALLALYVSLPAWLLIRVYGG